jgi:hypothetical protein
MPKGVEHGASSSGEFMIDGAINDYVNGIEAIYSMQ